MRQEPDFSLELNCNHKFIAGCDEAGRGPLCGPVVAAAVVFPKFDIDIPVCINDSKKMTKALRAKACDWIKQNTIWAVGQCSPAEIDDMNILWASMLAMERAVSALQIKPDFCLIDGNRMPKNLSGMPVVKGDAKSLSIAAASIIAKETRDAIMTDLANKFPEYCWDKNAGYPTQQHLQAIQKYGINEHYRKTFGPVKRIIDEFTNN
ncbi:MAG: ribonuclease HII [Alphaproteobacteria bacterium]